MLCCRAFLGFITRSRNVRNRLDGAKELKKLVYFSNIVVAPLLEDLQVSNGCVAGAPLLRFKGVHIRQELQCTHRPTDSSTEP